MKKYFLIIVLPVVFGLRAYCQKAGIDKTYQQVVDSLRNTYPTLKDSARVDCLNAMADAFTYLYNYNDEGFKNRGDSIFKYVSMANKEAKRIGYKYGQGMSILFLDDAERFMHGKDPAYIRGSDDSIHIIKVRQALQIAKEIQNEKLLGYAYWYLGGYENSMQNNKLAASYFDKAGELNRELDVLTSIVWNYTNGEQSVEGIEYAEKALQLAQKTKPVTSWDYELIQWSYKNMADLYKTAGDYETAIEYLQRSDAYGKATNGMREDIGLSELYYLKGNYDSAVIDWDIWKTKYSTYYFGHKAFGNTLRGKIYIKTGEYDKAIDMFNESLKILSVGGKYNTNMAFGLIRPLLFMGEAYMSKENHSKALHYVIDGLGFAEKVKDNQGQIQGYELISRIYNQLHNNDSAYKYLRKYIVLKDSVQNKQFIWRLNNYKRAAEDSRKESRIGFLDRDNKIKQQQLKQAATFRNFLIAAFIAFVFAGLYIFRNINLKRRNEKLRQQQKEQEWKLKELENENKHFELQKQSAELEMQALRAQMNPHFIFNCLSSINRFILKNESKVASNYLTRFSRLMRMVLNNSQKPLISLDDELEMLEIYLEMERLRFKNSFDYGITFLNTVVSDNIFIPPLLLQPFCENAIWHGLMHKKQQGRLDIQLTMQDNILNCAITDNGVGREKAEEMNTKTAEKEKSMGLRITTERLALLNRDESLQTNYKIEDLKDEEGNAAGTKVTLKVYFKKSVEELA